jgi:hypothetical protein
MVQQFLKTANAQVAHDPVTNSKYTPKRKKNIHLCKDLYMGGHSSIIHDSQKTETTQMYINL